MRKLLTPAIVALSIGAIVAFMIWVFVPLDAWRRVLSDQMLWSLMLYFLAVFAAFFLYVCTTTFVRIEAKRKEELNARWLYVQWVLISGAIGLFAGGLYNPGEDSDYRSVAAHKAANALTVFAIFLAAGLLGTAAGLNKLKKAKADALKPEQDGEGMEPTE
jgi:H+/Cl- antiporter ClcA